MSQDEKEKKLNTKFKYIFIFIAALLLVVAIWAYTGYKRSRANDFKLAGVKEMRYGNYEQATDYFGKAIDGDKNFAPPYYLIGVSYYNKYRNESFFFYSETESKDKDKYLNYIWEYLNKALAVNSDYPEAHIYLGVYYYEKKQFDNALSEFKKGKELVAKIWKDDKKKTKKWGVFVENALNVMENKNKSEALLEINSVVIDNLRGKIKDQAKLQTLEYLGMNEYTSQELRDVLKQFELNDEEIETVLSCAFCKIPYPPEPDEFKELEKPEKEKSKLYPF